jgi:cytochrome c biogenesis protein CcmG, thiol:disulfide interchange protein DsbE
VNRKVRGRILFLATAILAIGALLNIARRHPSHLPGSVGPASSAPELTLKQWNGTPLRLSDYAGKVILLDFFATWCSPCREEIPHFVAWQSKYGNQGLQIIGVSMDDDPRPVEKFSRELGINYPVVIGSQELASRYGGILGLPANIVIGRDGKIVSKHLGVADLSQLQLELTAQLALKQ